MLSSISRGVVLVVVAVAAVASSIPHTDGAKASSSKRKCLPRHAGIVKKSGRLKMYEREIDEGFQLRACYFKYGRSLRIADSSGLRDGVSYTRPTVSGRCAAVLSYSYDSLGSYDFGISSFNVRAKRMVGSWSDAAMRYLVDLRLASDCRPVWVERAPDNMIRIRAGDRKGQETIQLIAAGPDIDPKSLTVSGTTVGWQESGVRRVASL